MAYIGNPPAEAYTNTVKDSFNGDGSTVAFTMSQPSVTNDVRVVVENVIQDPTVAYSCSGTTLTFTSAPPSGTNNIYVVHLGPAVMTTVPPSEIASATTFASGVTVQGAFTSPGIDDNATSTAITIDSSERVKFGTTSNTPASAGVAGIVFGDNTVGTPKVGVASFSSDGAAPVLLTRLNSDGNILGLAKDGSTVGSIGSYSGSFLKIQSAGNQSGTLYGTTAHYPLKNDALSDADIDLGGTSNRFKDAYLSGGVYLGGVGSSNLLDDYEEGTWTPTWTSSGTNPTVSYNAQIGKYTKVGNKVFAWGGISANPTGAGTGSIFLNGLPFNPNTSAEIAGGQVGLCDHFDSGYTPLVIHADNNNSYCWLYYSTSHGGYTNNSVPANALRNGTLYFSVSYAVY